MARPLLPCLICTGDRHESLYALNATVCRSCKRAYDQIVPKAREHGLSPAMILGWETGLILLNRIRVEEGRTDELVDARTREPSPIPEEVQLCDG